MTVKKIRYICVDCHHYHTYNDLVIRRTIEIDKRETRYQHNCKNCNGKKFKIVSVVKW